MNIPFSPPYIDDDVINEVVNTLKSGWITTGPKTNQLEKELENLSCVEKVLCVNSASSGLMAALNWFGVGIGDEVIIPAYTYAATALAVMHVGAKPIMADCNEDLTINDKELYKLVTKNTKAIIPVDIGGLPCNYKNLKEFVMKPEVKGLFRPSSHQQECLGRILMLSDSAHSIGSTYCGKPAVLQSDFAVYSFHAVKNITAAEGGAIVINLPIPFCNTKVYNELKLDSLNGQTKDAYAKSKAGQWEYDIVRLGYKINLPDVLASIALAQIKIYQKKLLPKRRIICNLYDNNLKENTKFILPTQIDVDRVSSYHLYPLLIEGIDKNQRDKLIQNLSNDGVGVNVHYKPLPALTLFKENGFCLKNYPMARKCFEREISLPIHHNLSDCDIKRISDLILSYSNRL